MNQNAELDLRNFTDHNFSPLVELSNTAYSGRDIADLSFLNWEYLHNPDGNALITSAIANNDTDESSREGSQKIVSQYIVLPRRYVVNGKLSLGSLSVNSLTHPDFRGVGLFEKLALMTFNRCRENNIRFTIGFPNPISSPIIERKKLFSVMGSLPVLIKTLNPVRSLMGYVSSGKDKTGDEIDLHLQDENYRLKHEISIFDVEADRDKYSLLLNEFSGMPRNTTYRSPEYLSWRYRQIPRRTYTMLKLVKHDRIAAIAILRGRIMYGMRTCILVDLISNDHAASDELISFVLSYCRLIKMDIVLTTVPRHSSEYKLVKSHGFLVIPNFILPQKLDVIFRNHGDAPSDNTGEFSNWFLTFGDYDIF